MANRIGAQAVLFKPFAGPPVQAAHLIGLLFCQACSQGIGEEGMIAVPLTMVIEWYDKQVGAFEVFQGGLSGIGKVA